MIRSKSPCPAATPHPTRGPAPSAMVSPTMFCDVTPEREPSGCLTLELFQTRFQTQQRTSVLWALGRKDLVIKCRLSQDHSGTSVPGWGFPTPYWHWWPVHTEREIRWREFRPEAHRSWHLVQRLHPTQTLARFSSEPPTWSGWAAGSGLGQGERAGILCTPWGCLGPETARLARSLLLTVDAPKKFDLYFTLAGRPFLP